MRFTPDQLQTLALTSLQEAVTQCREGPLKPTAMLRFTLAYLANEFEDRQPFDDFWRAVTNKHEGENPSMVGLMRSSAASGALHRIREVVGH